MAVDKLVDSTQLNSDLTSVANAIRTKGGTSASLAFPADFVSAINAIPSGGGGVTISPMDYSVKIKNGRSGSITINRLLYNETTFLAVTSSNISSGSTSTYSNLATDGTHFWIRTSAGTTISYNGSQATYVKDGSYFEMTIPTGFDGTIEFIVT